MYFDLLSTTPPPLPKRLPKFVSHTISQVPEYMRPAAAQALFPPVAAQIYDVVFRYNDNVLHEPVCCMEGCVADSGVGKGYLDPMIEEIIRPLREHDRESERKLEEWATACNTKGSNKDKPARPLDAALLTPEPDMTNAALLVIIKDAEREGNRSIYTLLPEIDLLDQCCASHKKVTKVIRLNYDTKLYGAQRATANGITGKAHLRWKFNFSCVPETAREFFNGKAMTDGTLGRVGISFAMKSATSGKHGISRQGNYDEAYRRQLDEYLTRIRSASGQGEIKVPKIERLMDRLISELDEYCILADDKIFTGFEHRSLEIGWLKGCLCYIAEGYRWSHEIAEFVEWSIYYDLWSKIHIFCSQMKKSSDTTPVDKRRFGPVNMLDKLPDIFSQTQWEEMRRSFDKPYDDKGQLYNWLSRKLVTYSAQTGLYTKTDRYLKRK